MQAKGHISCKLGRLFSKLGPGVRAAGPPTKQAGPHGRTARARRLKRERRRARQRPPGPATVRLPALRPSPRRCGGPVGLPRHPPGPTRALCVAYHSQTLPMAAKPWRSDERARNHCQWRPSHGGHGFAAIGSPCEPRGSRGPAQPGRVCGQGMGGERRARWSAGTAPLDMPAPPCRPQSPACHPMARGLPPKQQPWQYPT